MPSQSDAFGHSGYKYEPKWDKLVERHPDKVPSGSLYIRESLDVSRNDVKRKDDIMLFGIKGLGVMVMRLGEKERCCAIFTNEELMHLTLDEVSERIWSDAAATTIGVPHVHLDEPVP